MNGGVAAADLGEDREGRKNKRNREKMWRWTDYISKKNQVNIYIYYHEQTDAEPGTVGKKY
jgi:hypothetical protein